MSEESLNYYDEELLSLEEEIRKGLVAVKKADAKTKEDKLKIVEDKMKRARRVFRNFKIELRDVTSPAKANFENKSRAHNTTLTQLQNELNWSKTHEARSDLLGQEENNNNGGKKGRKGVTTKGEDGAAAENEENREVRVGRRVKKEVKDMNGAELFGEINRTQDASLASLERSRRIAANTEEIGTNTAAMLAAQTSQMAKIDENLDELASNVKRAKAEMNAFIRRLATDKLIMVIVIIIIIAVIVGIILIILTKGKVGDILKKKLLGNKE